MDDTLANIAHEFEDDLSENTSDQSSSEKNTNLGSSSSTYNLLVNPKQRGNPLLKAIRNVTWELSDIIPDYQMGQTSCALFLSLCYHNLNPDYIHERLKQLGNAYQLRVLLVLVDNKDPHHMLKNLTRICILADLTLILAWSFEEAGKIIETYKIYENKPADNIRERGESSAYLRLIQALVTIKPINKSDAMALIDKFKTLEGILQASEHQIASLPGIGERKAKKLYNTLHAKFCK